MSIGPNQNSRMITMHLKCVYSVILIILNGYYLQLLFINVLVFQLLVKFYIKQLHDGDMAQAIVLHSHILGDLLCLVFSTEFRHSVFNSLWLLQRSERMVLKYRNPHALANCNSDVWVQSYACLKQLCFFFNLFSFEMF